MAKFLNCDSLATTATARRSQMLFGKFGMETLHEIAYEEYKYDGDVVFKTLHDGATHGKLMFMELK